MWQSFLVYLQDNPKGYWFRAKRFGWGWMPATWQGWFSLSVYVLAIVLVFRRTDIRSHSASDTLFGVSLPVVALTALLIAVCYWKGEPPRWSWGNPRKKDTRRFFRLIDPFLTRPAISGPDGIPPKMSEIAQAVAREKNRAMAVQSAYEKLSKRFHGRRWLTFIRPDRFLITDIGTLWNKKVLHCNHLNYLFRAVLIASGRFTSDDIVARWTFVWFISPHQYLLVRLEDGSWLPVDLWARSYGIPFGSYAHGFRSGTLKQESGTS